MIEKHNSALKRKAAKQQGQKLQIQNMIASGNWKTSRVWKKLGRLSLAYTAIFLFLTGINFLLIDMLKPDKKGSTGRMWEQIQLTRVTDNLGIMDNLSYSLIEVKQWAE